jgi:hypothetical protein
MGLVLFLLLYVAVPYLVYRVVLHWTGSGAVSWTAAIIAIPIGVFLSVWTFEAVEARISAEQTPWRQYEF